VAKPVDVVKSFVSCFAEGRYEDAYDHLANDLAMHHNTRLPYGGEYRGRDGFQAMQETMLAFWERFDAAGETQVLAHGDDCAVVIGALPGKPRCCDEEITVPVIERYRIQDGLIAEIWVFYVDTHLSAAQIG
jgi:hypothetical protein